MSQRHSDHAQDHTDVPSDPTLRVKALESLLVEKGLVDTYPPLSWGGGRPPANSSASGAPCGDSPDRD